MEEDIVYRDSGYAFTDTAAVVWARAGYLDADIVRRCRACGEIFLEDPIMYDSGICPACGSTL